jgi:ATP-binding cassette, subfamily C, bacterial CydD
MRALDPRLLSRTRSARPLLALDTALGLGAAVAILVQATTLARIVAAGVHGTQLGALSGDFLVLVVTFAVRGGCVWAMEVTGRRAAWDVLSELRMALVRKRLSTQPFGLEGADSGEVAAVSVQGIDALESYFARYLPQVILASVVPVLVIIWVATVDWEAALIMLLTLPLVPVFMWLIGRYTEQRTRERWQALRLLSNHFLDVVRGLPTLRAFGRSRHQEAVIAAVGERYRQATMQTLRVSFLSGSVLELAATLGVALVAVATGLSLVAGSLGLEAGLTVLILAPELYLPFRRLGAEYHASADGLAVAERMFALLNAPALVPPGGPLVPPNPAFVPVRFEAVSFAYPGRAQAVVKGLDLELSPGCTTALVGASGAGKSTVAALLMGLLRPDTGRISIGGVDLARCQMAAWRELVAWVPQHPHLLRDTVAENIRLGDPLASDRQIADAAAQAGADEFITGLPRGYQTVVGDGGRVLSPGERRRIGLARAFLKGAPLLVLDEPTADLDPDSVAIVSVAVRRLQSRRTVLLIAHRSELIQEADQVLRLSEGRVIAEPVRVAA